MHTLPVSHYNDSRPVWNTAECRRRILIARRSAARHHGCLLNRTLAFHPTGIEFVIVVELREVSHGVHNSLRVL
jgi:hypothetical protein